MAFRLVEGSFTGTGQSDSFRITDDRTNAFQNMTVFNVVLSGTFSATVAIQRSFDDGATWHTISKNADGDAAQYTAPAGISITEIEGRDESPVLYRLNCTSYTSGTVNYRMSM